MVIGPIGHTKGLAFDDGVQPHPFRRFSYSKSVGGERRQHVLVPAGGDQNELSLTHDDAVIDVLPRGYAVVTGVYIPFARIFERARSRCSARWHTIAARKTFP